MAIVSNMFNKNRMNLGVELPLETPLVIQLETSGFCNLECKFCPCGDEEARKLFPQEIMSEELFDLFLEQCSAFPHSIKILRIIGIGEPLINKNISTFVKKAKNSNLFERVEITTNGVLLTEELSNQLIDAGLDVLLVSLEATDEDVFYNITGRRVDLKVFKERLRYFYNQKKNTSTKLYIKTTNLGTDNPNDFIKEYGDFCDYIYIENVIENWPEFSSGAIEGAVRYDIDVYKGEKKVCIQPFKLMCISANGDVNPCSVDWKRALYLGNIREKSLVDIWNGEKRNSLLKSLLCLQPCEFCSNCKYVFQNQPDDIDDYRLDILKRMSEGRP